MLDGASRLNVGFPPDPAAPPEIVRYQVDILIVAARHDRGRQLDLRITNSNATEPRFKRLSIDSFRWMEPYLADCIAQSAGRRRTEVARYFFDVKNGHRLIDPAGIDCRNDREAIKAGVMIAQQIAADAPPTQPRHVAVLNDEREEVGQIPINDNGKEDQYGGQ